MTWISLVCLLALSGTVFTRSVPFGNGGYGGYGGYGSGAIIQTAPKILNPIREVISRPAVISSGYGATEVIQPAIETVGPKVFGGYEQTVTKVLPTGGYGSNFASRAFLDQPAATVVSSGPATTVVSSGPAPVVAVPVQPLTPADMLCQNKLPETVIPLEGGRRFVVCLDDTKGVEQFCPKGLIYVPELRRCERSTGPLDACASQPCLNGGLCVNTEYTYQCQCPQGSDGKNCELDARICHTQQPCGLAPDARCQSFRWGAALEYLCVFQEGEGYGLTAAQVHTSPCKGIDGPHALAFTSKGFIMCDGERTFFESCPGGTLWDDFNKACVWPDMQFEPIPVVGVGHRALIGQSGYGSGYGASVVVEQPKPIIATRVLEPVRQGYGGETIVTKSIGGPAYGGYGGETIVTKTLEPVRPLAPAYGGYGGETIVTKTLEPVRPLAPAYGGYGGETIVTKTLEPVRPLAPAYGAPAVVSSYGAPAIATRVHVEQPRVISSYGGQREEVVVKNGY